MTQEFLTPSMIAPEALVLLSSNMVTSQLFYRGYEMMFTGSEKVGDTIQIRNRGKGVVREYGGSSVTVDDIDESPITLTLEKHYDLTVKITSRDMRLDLKDFSSQILAPNILEVAETVDAYAATKLKDLPNVAGPSASAPAGLPASIADMALVDKTANDLKWPTFPRHQIASTTYKATILGVASFVEVDKSGADDALRHAFINNLMGFDTYMSQNVESTTHTAGTQTTMVTSAAIAKGATTIPYDTAGQATGTLVAGDIVTISGYGNVVVAANAAAVSNAGSFTIKEPLRADVADVTAMTLYDTGGSRQNHGAIFHPRALALAIIPLNQPMSAVNSFMIEENGISLRVVIDWDRDLKSDVLSMDVLMGAKVVDGRLGAQIVQNI